jgi:DNA-binding GntR family transcriptional regulator
VLIEPKAAELAHGHDRDGALKALTAAVADMKQAVAAKDTLAYGSADTAFHDALFVHCGNHYLMQSYQLIAGRIAALRTNLSSPLDVQTPASFDQHRELLDLFERGKFEGFTKLMTLHITNSGHAYARALEVA